MSSKIMGQVWDFDLSPTEQSVLLAMADHADHDGNNVFPRIGLIAWKVGLSVRQCRRVVADLKRTGLLEPTGVTKGGVIVYRIEVGAGTMKPPYVEEEAGRPPGTREMARRERAEKMGDNLSRDMGDTPFYVTHNHHSQLTVSNSSYLQRNSENHNQERPDEIGCQEPEWQDDFGDGFP